MKRQCFKTKYRTRRAVTATVAAIHCVLGIEIHVSKHRNRRPLWTSKVNAIMAVLFNGTDVILSQKHRENGIDSRELHLCKTKAAITAKRLDAGRFRALRK